MLSPGQIRAFGEHLLVEVEDPPEQSKGGVFLPQGNLEERLGYVIGKVLSVGQGKFNKGKAAVKSGKFTPHDVQVGDRVMLRGYLHGVVRYYQPIDGLKHSLIHIDWVEGVLKD
jgi:co-chaperonin GroES (HSP10)